MSDEHVSDGQLVDLAVDHLAGEEREQLLEHLAVCGRCRTEYDVLSAAAEQMLSAAPAVEPPPGFDTRVLDGLGLADARRHTFRSTRRRPMLIRWRVAAAAAVAGLALGAGGVALWEAAQDSPANVVARSFLTTSDGERVGTVTRTLVDGDPALVITVSDAKVGMEYLCRLRLEDGRRMDVATWTIRTDENQSWVVPAGADVASVVLVADAGDGPVWSSATV